MAGSIQSAGGRKLLFGVLQIEDDRHITVKNLQQVDDFCIVRAAARRTDQIDGSMRRRLQDLGLIEGTRVECLQRSPSGDPTAYLIRGAVIALREEDSSKIIVETAQYQCLCLFR